MDQHVFAKIGFTYHLTIIVKYEYWNFLATDMAKLASNHRLWLESNCSISVFRKLQYSYWNIMDR